MTIKHLLAACGAVASLTACSSGFVPDPHFEYQLSSMGPTPYVAALALATPPANQIVFGPCNEEFGMPDSRSANCKLYYRIRRQTSPWEQRKAEFAAAAYKPGELTCWRTLGEISECAVVSGPPKRPPAIVSPNNLHSE
jgi:hypothetical protein